MSEYDEYRDAAERPKPKHKQQDSGGKHSKPSDNQASGENPGCMVVGAPVVVGIGMVVTLVVSVWRRAR
ncbi:hypothetical protein ACWDRR_00835 [Kitasatospora sp. NPDC003701]